MIHLHFFLRYHSQLSRIRPELVARLEEISSNAAYAAGGKAKKGRRLLSATFDENSIVFWLDMLICLKTIDAALKEGERELYGWSLCLMRDEAGRPPEETSRILSGGRGGIFCDSGAGEALDAYLVFDEAASSPTGFYKLKSFRDFPLPDEKKFPLRRKLSAFLEKTQVNALLLGPALSGKRDALRYFVKKILSACPQAPSPPVIRFGSGGISCLADPWTGDLRDALLKIVPREQISELDLLSGAISRERLRDEVSQNLDRKTRRFFSLFLENYLGAMKNLKVPAFLILENLHLAPEPALRIIFEVWAEFEGKKDLRVYGIFSVEKTGQIENEEQWRNLFPQMIQTNSPEKIRTSKGPDRSLPVDLWEMACLFQVLGNYFPGSLFTRLLVEEGKTPAMVQAALEMLVSRGLIDDFDDPVPHIPGFLAQAQAVLGERMEKIHKLVLNRLLDWVKRGNLAPCFRLLEILSGLGGTGDDELVFRSLQADLLNHTWSAIDRALSEKTFKLVAGKDRAAALEYIYGSLKVLITGNERDIRSWFKSPLKKAVYVPYKAHILNSHACFFLGIGASAQALEAVKEAIHLSQNRSWAGLARAYRLFALVNLSRRRMESSFRESGTSGEALEYSGFAVENAEKSGDPDELAISAYYAASIQLLFGNISKALRYVTQAEESALAAGRNNWADRACFLRGKIRFETGHYREALILFERIQEKPHDGMTKEKKMLLDDWAYRTRIYSQNPLSPKPSKCGIDGHLFEIEAAWLSGNCKLAVEAAARFSDRLPQGDEFLHIEQPDWYSGFAQCEFLLIPRTDLFTRMCCTFQSLALAKISRGEEESYRSFQHFLRDDRFSEMDPNDPFYFYAWFKILEESGAAQVDMNTAVSMAFKRLQRRATRIDDMETRRDWLSLPRWNAALSRAAREYKLI
ncbi:MAG: hypothetical protein LBE10_08920 [Treponema sp.]|jgi:tetratricopeptide (TPR) repeat protein|nr:hypothetical protein [Treponema sp.]